MAYLGCLNGLLGLIWWHRVCFEFFEIVLFEFSYGVYGLYVGVLRVRIMCGVCGRRCKCVIHALCERRCAFGGFWM